MLTRVTTRNIFEPADRSIEKIFWRKGITVRDLTPSEWELNERVAIYINGSLIEDPDTELKDEDIVGFVASPTDPVTVVLYVVAAFAVSYAVSKIIDNQTAGLMDQETNPDGSSTYGYYGFRNSYRSEGDPLPVVYGKIRVAPPCVNQVVLDSTDLVGTLVRSEREELHSLYAISEGPIYGLGLYRSPVESQEDQTTLTNGQSQAALTNTKLQINGISATNFFAKMQWRTGTESQDAIVGRDGYITYTDSGAVYSIGLRPAYGTLASEIAQAAGVYAYADRILESNSANFVSQQILQSSDNAVVQIFFDRGLFGTNSNTGELETAQQTVRVQYWKIDSGGSALTDVVVLPALNFTGAGQTPFVFDFPFSFQEPGTVASPTYTPPVEGGYLDANADLDDYAKNFNDTGLNIIRPTAADTTTQLKFTITCWVKAQTWATAAFNHCIYSWSRPDGTSITFNNGGFHDLLGVAGSDIGHALFFKRDINNTLGNGSDACYLVLYAWDATGSSTTYDGAVRWSCQVTSSSAEDTDGIFDNIGGALGWHHVAVSYDASTYGDGTPATVKMWVNGVPKTVTMDPYNPGRGSGPAGAPHVPLRWRTGGSDTDWVVGRFQSYTSSADRYESRIDLAEMMIYDDIMTDSQLFQIAGSSSRDKFGNIAFSILAYENDDKARAIFPFSSQDSTTSGFYRNYALGADQDGTLTEAKGHLTINDPSNTAQTTGGPVWTAESDTAPTDTFWQVEVFAGDASSDNGTVGSDMPIIDTITGFSSQKFQYPSTAVMSVSIMADSQVSNQEPTVTALCYGRLVPVYKDSTADGSPLFETEWSQNPAWIAVDLITNKRYGLGQQFGFDSIDANSFKEWADFCSEGVPDAFGSLDFFSLKLEGDTVSSDQDELWLKIRIGLLPYGADANTQTIPQSWAARDQTGFQMGDVQGDALSFLSITQVTDDGLIPDWVTANDMELGRNNASNRMGIYSIEYLNDTSGSGYHGWETYAEVRVRWQRQDSSSGDAIWPSGSSEGDEIFADDDFGLTSLGKVSGYEDRCHFDGVFDQADTSGWDALLAVFTAGRAMPVKVGSKIYASIDKPRDPVAVFGPANIIAGSLELSYLGPGNKPNSIEADILDSQKNFDRETILVDHSSVQNPTKFSSFRKERVDFRGITRRSQATRDATYRLNRYHLLRRAASFDVGPDAVNLLPGDRFRLSHDVPQYGYGGRLRGDQTVVNSLTSDTQSLYRSWGYTGGNCAASGWAHIVEESLSDVARPPGYDSSLNLVSTMRGVPMGAIGVLARKGGSDGYESKFAPYWATQHITTANTMYPPGEMISPLDQIQSATYTTTWSAYVREPAKGASTRIRVSIYRLVDIAGTQIDQSYEADFAWSSGSLAVSGTPTTGITATATAVSGSPSGWYRITVSYNNATASPTGSIGDYLQARVYAIDSTAQTFKRVADGGRGVNFLKYGDPLDINGKDGGSAVWTLYNTGISGKANAITHSTSIAPPFYPDATGSTDGGKYGYVVQLVKDATISLGTTPTNLVQTVSTLPTGSAVSSWNGERVCLTIFARLDASNASSNATLYLDLRVAATVDSNNILTGDGIRAVVTMTGTPALSSISKTEGSGTVANEAGTVAAVVQNSSTNDSNWVQIDLSFDYTPSSGTMTALTFGAMLDGVTGGNAAVDIWNPRIHGAGGTSASPASTDLVNPYYHRALTAWGLMYEPEVSSVSDFSVGSTFKLDRDVVLEAGNTYELLLRSSFGTSAADGIDGQEVVQVDSAQVPGSGSTTISANSNLNCLTPANFVAREGDVYAFGKTGVSSADFVVESISLNPETMTRHIKAIEYNESVYNDTEFGEVGVTTVSDLPTPGAQENAQFGFGGGTTLGAGGINFSGLATAERNANGGSQPVITFSWQWPRRQRSPKEVRIWLLSADNLSGTTARLSKEPIQVGVASARGGSFVYKSSTIDPKKTYIAYLQAVGYSGTSLPLTSCPQTVVNPVSVPNLPKAPTVTTSSRGFKQIYTVSDPSSSAGVVNAIEGRIGGWIMGTPAYSIDPQAGRFVSEALLTGQANAQGVIGANIVSRPKLASGFYGRQSIVQGTDQTRDVGYTHSTACENDYTAVGAITTDLAINAAGYIEWNSSSSELTATYTPLEINLGSAQRVLANCFVEGTQGRPETLADLNFTLGSQKGRRWSLEGPMDNSDGDNSTVVIDWRWTSGTSLSSVEYTRFEPGIVYAQKVQFRITFTRPTASYSMRIDRVVTQALTLPSFDNNLTAIDGGTF